MDNVSFRVVVLTLVAISLTACGDKGKSEPATQVAAKVNSGEITVHQVNFALQRANLSSPDQMKPASRQALDRLVDQELLVQAATEKKLDRDPRVVQAIEAARREVIARAYLEQVAADAGAKPGESEIKDYYAKHPALFSGRRIYDFREIAVEKGPGVEEKVRAQLAKSQSLDELAAWLKAENLRFATNTFVKPAEQLPLESLATFHAMKDGDVKVSSSAQAVQVVQLASSRSEPVDEAKARPMIEQFLVNQRRAEAAKVEIARLRGSAKIEKVGEFAEAPVADVAISSNQAASHAQQPAADGLEKGIKGLK